MLPKESTFSRVPERDKNDRFSPQTQTPTIARVGSNDTRYVLGLNSSSSGQALYFFGKLHWSDV